MKGDEQSQASSEGSKRSIGRGYRPGEDAIAGNVGRRSVVVKRDER